MLNANSAGLLTTSKERPQQLYLRAYDSWKALVGISERASCFVTKFVGYKLNKKNSLVMQVFHVFQETV